MSALTHIQMSPAKMSSERSAASLARAGGLIETNIPARLDSLLWSGFHTRVIAALGITWILDGLEVTLDRPATLTPDTTAGLVLGFVFLFFRQSVVNAVQFLTGQNLWDPSIRFLSELPSRSDPMEVLAICAMALVLSFLATLYPAWKAASTDPVQVLRYE